MKIDTIKIKGITTFNEMEYDFKTVPEGVIAINGKNGSGKTTFLESIAYALVNDTPSREGVSIYNQCNQNDAMIELSYTLNDKNYLHQLYIDSKGRKQEGYLFIDTIPVVDGKIKVYKEYCKEKIIDELTFYSSFYNSQNNKGNFLELSEKDRKKLIIEALGLEKLEKISQLAKEEKKILENQIESLTIVLNEYLSKGVDLPDLEAVIQDIKIEIQGCQKDLEEHNESNESLQSQKIKLEGDAKAIRNDVDKVNQQRNEYLVKSKQKEELSQKIENNINLLKINKDDLENSELKYDDLVNNILANLKLQLENKDLDLNILNNDYNQKIEKINNELLPLQEKKNSKINDLNKKINNLNIELKNYKLETNKINNKIESLNKTAEYEFESDRKKYQSQINLQKNILNNHETQMKLLTEVPCGTQFNDCKFKANAIKAQNEYEDSNNKYKELVKLYDTCNLQSYLDGKDEELTQCYNEIDSFSNKVTQTEDEINSLDSLISQLNDEYFNQSTELIDSKNEIELKYKKDKLILQENVKSIQLNIQQVNIQIDSLGKQINNYKIKIGQIEKILPEYNNQLEQYNLYFSVNVLSDPPDDQTLKDLESKIQKLLFDIQQSKLLLQQKKEYIEGLNLKRQRHEIEIENSLKLDLEIKELQNKINNLKLEASDYNYLELTFGSNGIQALEIDAAGPQLSALTNDLLFNCFNDRFSVEFITTKPKVSSDKLKEVFTLTVYDSLTGHEGDVKEFSGGEKTIISIAVQLAMSLFNASKSGLNFKTLFFDEITSALSEENSLLCTRMLKRARILGDFSQIFFITHSPLALEESDFIINVEDGQLERIK